MLAEENGSEGPTYMEGIMQEILTSLKLDALVKSGYSKGTEKFRIHYSDFCFGFLFRMLKGPFVLNLI